MYVLSLVKELIAFGAIVVSILLVAWSVVRRTRGWLSWRAIEYATLDLDRQMTASGFQPDLIICLGRSGSIAGAMLSEFLPQIPAVVTLCFGNRRNTPKPSIHASRQLQMESMIALCPLKESLKHILLLSVDIISGNTMNTALEELRKKDIAPTEIACLFWCPEASVKPRYYHKPCKSRRVYPWERPAIRGVWKDISRLVNKVWK
jgi:hypoxanthine phosphoribosyltransferase